MSILICFMAWNKFVALIYSYFYDDDDDDDETYICIVHCYKLI